MLPVPDDQRVSLLALVLGYQYVNRLVNVFVVEDQLRAPAVLLPLLERAFTTGIARRMVAVPLPPGRAVPLLPVTDLPADLAWAAADARLAAAVGGAAAVLDTEVARWAGTPVLEAVTAALADWAGGDPGLSRAWVEPHLRGLSPDDEHVARFALLVARGPWQVDDAVADRAREALGGDEGLVVVACWAALAAARRVVGRLVLAHAQPT